MNARKTSTWSTLVYSYKAKAPLNNTVLMEQQFMSAHRYYNDLIGLEIDRRAKYHELLASLEPSISGIVAEISSIDLQIEELRKQVRAERAGSTSKKVVSTLPAEITRLIKSVKLLRSQKKCIEEKIKKDEDGVYGFVEKNKVLYADHKVLSLKARSLCFLRSSSYVEVEAAVKKAVASKGRIKYKKEYTGEGLLAAQIKWGQKGVAVVPDMFNPNLGVKKPTSWLYGRDLFGKDTRVHINSIDLTRVIDNKGERWEGSRPEIKRKCRTVAHLSIIKSNTGKSASISIPFTMHRPIPLNAQIKWVKLVREKVVNKFEYYLQFTIEVPPSAKKTGSGEMGMDLGWRESPEGIRVAYTTGVTDSNEQLSGELVLSKSIVDRIKKADEIRSGRDKSYDDIREWLIQTIKHIDGLPDWVSERTKGMSKWRSPDRLMSVIRYWRDNRFDGDSLIFSKLASWDKSNLKNHKKETKMRIRASRHRRETYRIWSKKTANQFSTIKIENFRIDKVAELSSEEDNKDDVGGRHNRVLVAASILRLTLKNACSKVGGRIVVVKAAYTSRKCHSCGHNKKWENPSEQIHVCGGCGQTWDRDYNASINILNSSGVDLK